jgi:hypothetical protein
MRRGMFTRGMASLLAFGHTRGLAGQRNARAAEQGRAVAKTVYIEEPSMTARDMGVTFESDPELYRAIHPIFNGRNRANE